MKKLLIIIGLVIAVLIGTITQSSAQLINGCISKSNGTLRIVTNSSDCKSSESFISWNQQGPKGDPTYVRTALVSPVGTVTQNGMALLNALAGITTASSTNPYLLKIEPGIYDIGTSSFQMQAYVDVEGSGEDTTIITGHVNGFTGVVQGTNNAEIRFLTVKNTGGGDTEGVAISNTSASPKITNVTASASGGTNNYGVFNGNSSPTMTNVKASASGGTYNYGVYNNTSSPTMTNITASALRGSEYKDGSYHFGVYNNTSSPTMTNMTAFAFGGTFNYGVLNATSSPTMTNMTASTSTGYYQVGVENHGSSPTMSNVTAFTVGGEFSYGVANFTSGTVQINHSVILGSTKAVFNMPGVITLIANTHLNGEAYNGGTLVCAGVYNYYEPYICP